MRIRDIAVIFFSLAVILTLAMKIDIYDYAYSMPGGDAEVPVFLRFLGESRSIVSKLSILQADLYFHGGVGHFSEEHAEGLAMSDMSKDEHHHHDGESECHHDDDGDLIHDDHHHDEDLNSGINPFNILFRISAQTEMTEHKHLHGDQIKEIIPWLYYSARIDPHNIQAYVLTGFYLADRMGRVDQAISFLKEGLRNNPDSWQITAEIGRIYFKYLDNYGNAEYYFSKALKLMNNEPHDKFEERYVLTFLAMSYDKMGEPERSGPLYTRINELFPDNRYRQI